jgi:heme/copper-type cytochrome/quinol oxidase subunit 2
MNKPISKKAPTSHKTVIFWTIIAAISLFFIGLVVYRFIDRQKEVTNLNELTNLREQQIFAQGGT